MRQQLLCLSLLTTISSSSFLENTVVESHVYKSALEAARQGDIELSLDLFEAALAANPNDPATLHSVGTLQFIAAGDADSAIHHHGRAKELDSTVLPPLALLYQNGESCNGVADVYWVSSHAKKSLFDAPHDTEKKYQAHLSLATQLEDSGLVEFAAIHFKAAGMLQPHRIDLRLRNALMVPVLYDSEEHLSSTRAELEENVISLLQSNISLENLDQISMPGTFYIVYQGRNDVQLMTGIQRLYRQMYPAIEANSLVDSLIQPREFTSRNSKIRIGFVSSYFRRHSVCKLLCGVIRNLDREKFEVIMFSATDKQDSLTKWASKNATLVKLPRGFLLSNRHVAIEFNLDILVFPDLGMDTKTSMWASARLAPVQVCFWGHPSTTGMPSIDYFVTADGFEDDGGSNKFSEQLVRFDSPSFYFRPQKLDPNLSVDFLDELGRSEFYLVPQTLPKFSPGFDIILRDIAKYDQSGAPIVIIFNKDKVFWKNRLHRRLTAVMGEDLVSRIIFIPSLKTNEFQAVLNASTVLLDPYPFGGGVTSLEAFLFCKPVITAPGLQTVPALTAGFYSHMGIMELIANSPLKFVELAIKVRNDSQWRNRITQEICEKKKVLYENKDSVREWEGLFQRVSTSTRN